VCPDDRKEAHYGARYESPSSWAPRRGPRAVGPESPLYKDCGRGREQVGLASPMSRQIDESRKQVSNGTASFPLASAISAMDAADT
jgi:hypothetical protein